MFTHNITTSYSTDSGQTATAPSPITQPVQAAYDQTVAISTTAEWDVALVHSKLKSLLIYATKAVQIKTYTGGTGGTLHDTINVAAGQLIAWNSSSAGAAPITADTDTITIHNASGTDTSNVKIYALLTL